MEASLQMFDVMGIHKKREEEKRQMASPSEMKEARKQIEAYIAANKGSSDPAVKAQLAQMEASLQMFDAMGIHKKREEEKRQMASPSEMKEARKQIEAYIAA